MVHPGPNQNHWVAIHRVFKYLRGTIDYGMCYGGFPNTLISDASWTSNLDKMKSTSRYVFTLRGGVSWKSAK